MYRWQKMLLSRIARIRPMKWDIYAPLYDLAQARCSYFQNQPPRLVVLTSEADYATKYAFPAGRIFSTLFETHGTINRNDCNLPLSYYSEGAADRQTVGHFEPLQSMNYIPSAQAWSRLMINQAKTIWESQLPEGSIQFGRTELTSLRRTVIHNPYLNVKVDKQLIAGHNDVFRPEIMEFIRMLIVVSTAE